MKLLSIAIPDHDVNLSYHDGSAVHYLKLERTRQEKRFNFQSLLDWKRETQNLWGLNVEDIEDFVFSFNPAALPESLRPYLGPEALRRIARDESRAERLAEPICQYLGVPRAWFISHHYSHALSTWMLEKRAPELRIVIDGLGDGRPWSVYQQDRLVAAGDIRNGSIGWGIREAGKLLDIQYGHYNDIAGKVMGLQSYGRVDPDYLERLRSFGIAELKELWSPQHWQAFKKDALLARLTLLDWIATVHARTGEVLLEFFKRFASAGDTISYSGGVAQNVIWNSVLKQHFPGLIIPPHSSDEGLSLGALEWLRRTHGLPELRLEAFPRVQSDIGVPDPSEQTIELAAHMLARGKIVGWYQGQGEVGPRALGNRSILMDPRIPNGKALLNRVKKREHYRPFGAAVLREHYARHFSGPADEFMLYTCQVQSQDFPAITHVDQSCRVQLVGEDNPVFRRLLVRFFELTGCPLLLNTSLNLAGKPMAAFPENAVQLFFDSQLDAVVVGDRVLRR